MAESVFISYAREDRSLAEWLARELTTAGVECWYDDDKLRGGADWLSEIETALDRCSTVIVLLSPSSVDVKSFVKKEYLLALEHAKTIIPVVTAPCRTPVALADLHRVDCRDDRDAALRELKRALGVVEGAPAASTILDSLLGVRQRDVFASFKRDAAVQMAEYQSLRESIRKQELEDRLRHESRAREIKEELSNKAGVSFLSSAWNLPDEPLLGFVEIPAGAFTVGNRSEKSAEHAVALPQFFLGRYEVTVAQFRRFAEETNVQPSTAALTGPDDCPVRNVSWYEAVAYVKWLDGQVRASKPRMLAKVFRNPGSWHVTLPTEAEWEKGARGTDRRDYPWGAFSLDIDMANYSKSRIGKPVAVGSYPKGASPYGLLDMSGNVREWTRSIHKPYPYVPKDPTRDNLDVHSRAPRVVRGGSFSTVEPNLAVTDRMKADPWKGYGDIGFRVAISSLP